MPNLSPRELSKLVSRWAFIREWQQDSVFKIKALQKIAQTLKTLNKEDILAGRCNHLFSSASLKWIIAALSENVFELLDHEQNKIPSGILELSKVRGLSAAKCRQIYEALGVQDLSGLEQACKEQRLLELKGFGKQSQDLILEQVLFLKASAGYVLYSEACAIDFKIRSLIPDNIQMEPIGTFSRNMEIINSMDYLVSDKDAVQACLNEHSFPVHIKLFPSDSEHWIFQKVLHTGPDHHLQSIGFHELLSYKFENESQLYKALNIPFVPAPQRDSFNIQKAALPNYNPVAANQIKGVLHVHTTYSDGSHTLQEMAGSVAQLGYSYLGVTDHSQSAFYANGLSEQRVLNQWTEIDQWNAQHPECYIFKGIESDILNDGTLDYPNELLQGFDFVIASVHAQLQMNRNKATNRLITAIEHPATRILGHMTGRLLLRRSGYDLDVPKVLQACAQNQVAVEINANPQRLDLDWRWIDYALEQGVWLAINPDAHSKEGLQDLHFGIKVAEKTGLKPERCLNCLDKQLLLNFFKRA